MKTNTQDKAMDCAGHDGKADSALIVRAVNEHDALVAVADCAADACRQNSVSVMHRLENALANLAALRKGAQ